MREQGHWLFSAAVAFHEMQPVMPRTLSIWMSSCAFTKCSGVGVRGVLSSRMIFSCRLAILMWFVAIVLLPEHANAQAFQMFTTNLTPQGSPTLTLDVEESDSIENVKQKNEDKILNEVGLYYLPQDQFLFYSGSFLQDGRTLADCNIRRESIISMAVIDSFDALSFSTSLPGPRGFTPFMMRSGISGAGEGWSVFNYTNAVDLSGTGIGTYTLDLVTVAPGVPNVTADALGVMPDFDGQQAYDWTFITATGGISGFSPNQFLIDSSQFANAFTGSFSVVQQGNRLAISYSPSSVPEIDPNSLGSVLALVLGSLGLLERRRLKAA